MILMELIKLSQSNLSL